MSPAPLLTVVTVTRNDADGLSRTLKSLAAQEVDWSQVEHLVVDGASTDGTRDAFETDRLPISRLVSEPDRGVYDAMNKGLRLSTGEYLQFLNSGDCLAGPESLGSICAALASRPTWLVARGVDGHGGHRPSHVIDNLPHTWWRHAMGIQPHCHQASILSRELLVVLDGHDERFGFVADFDVILRAGLVAAPQVLDQVVVHYEGGGMSEQRMTEIPRAIAHVRADRLALRGTTARLNVGLARMQEARIRVGRALGR